MKLFLAVSKRCKTGQHLCLGCMIGVEVVLILFSWGGRLYVTEEIILCVL